MKQKVEKRKRSRHNSPTLKHYPLAQVEVTSKVLPKKMMLTFVLLTLFCLCFFLTGIKWGQPASRSWNPDSQVGSWGLFHYNQLGTDQWTSKYPKGQPYITAPIYRYYLKKFSASPVVITLPNGERRLTVFDEYRYGKIIMASRYVTVAMAVLAVWAIFLSGKFLFDSYSAGLLSALAALLSIDFVFHAQLGNFDVPSTFWYAWSLYAAIRIVYSGRWRDYITFGFCTAYGFCTKDSLGGYSFGLAISIWLIITIRAKNELNLRFLKALLIIFNRRTLAAVIVAIITFGVLSDLFIYPSLFIERMKHWVGGEGVTNFNQNFEGHIWLLKKSFGNIYYAMGFPMLFAMFAGLVYGIYKYPQKIAFSVIPFIVFYIIIVMPIQMTTPRYYMPGIFALSLLPGKLFADMLEYKKVPKLITYILIITVYGMSAIYCFGICLEMRTDTRYRTEQWLSENITDKQTIIFGLDQQAYMPRIKIAGFDRHQYLRAKDMDTLKIISLYAEYIVARPAKIREYNLDVESLGYEQVARFGAKFIRPRKTVFSIPGRPYNNQNFVSRELVVYKKISPPHTQQPISEEARR